MSTIGLPASSLQKAATYGIPSIVSISNGVSVANGTISITSSYPSLPTIADPAYAQANVATGIATSSYSQANTATGIAQAAYSFANTISGGSAVDNVARVLAQSAYNAANSANSYANTINSTVILVNEFTQSAYTQANLAFSKANSSLTAAGNTSTSVQFGSFGVGTAASGTSGEIRATNEVTAYYSSDETLKENIAVISDALGKLKQVRGVMYDWKDSVIQSRGGLDDYFVRKHDTGVIAQDVEKVLPEVVAERPDGTKAVRYEKLAGIIIQAINELAEQVEEIKKRIE